MIGALALLVTAVSLTGCATTKPPDSSETREGDSPTEETGEQAKLTVTRQEVTGEVENSAESTTEETSGKLRCSEEEKKERQDLRLGDFEPPEDAPEYEIVDEQPVDRYGAKAAQLLVDTRARSEEDYALIARDIKSDYAVLDAVSVEFTDTTDTLSYNGRALIFNTPCGSDYLGYIHHPPNNEGYRVIVPKG
ncbi:MAG TPA: hypothetical protein VF558_02405 [Rubrobacteraceae bacterium]